MVEIFYCILCFNILMLWFYINYQIVCSFSIPTQLDLRININFKWSENNFCSVSHNFNLPAHAHRHPFATKPKNKLKTQPSSLHQLMLFTKISFKYNYNVILDIKSGSQTICMLYFSLDFAQNYFFIFLEFPCPPTACSCT